jgi:hypothetical protein
MAVSKLTCPECKTVLKPAKPLAPGKTVKCPECGSRFTAADDAPEAPLKKPKTASADDDAAPKKSADRKAVAKKSGDKKADKPKKPVAKPADDDDDEGGTYTFVGDHDESDKPDIEYAADMSIKDLRGPAASALVQPSNALIITGGLGFFGWIALLILILIPTLFPIDNDEGDKTKPPKAVIGLDHGLGAVNDSTDLPPEIKNDPNRKTMFALFGVNIAFVGLLAWYLFILSLLPIFLGMIYSGLVCYGAVKIQNLEARGWGIASSIMVMAPLNLGGFMMATSILLNFLVGMVLDDLKFIYGVLIFMMVVESLAAIGVGVWALTTLLSEKVIKGYEYKGE